MMVYWMKGRGEGGGVKGQYKGGGKRGVRTWKIKAEERRDRIKIVWREVRGEGGQDNDGEKRSENHNKQNKDGREGS